MSTSHVLVVDDEADIRALIQEILSDEGYGVTAAANANEARDARADAKFDGTQIVEMFDQLIRRDANKPWRETTLRYKRSVRTRG